MPHSKSKEVQPENDKSGQAKDSLNDPQTDDGTYPSEVPGSVDPNSEPYSDPDVDPASLLIASDPDPALDPMVSKDAAQPIGTGSEAQALAEKSTEVISPELENKDNPRIHGRHHERHMGRPIESISQDRPMPSADSD